MTGEASAFTLPADAPAWVLPYGAAVRERPGGHHRGRRGRRRIRLPGAVPGRRRLRAAHRVRCGRPVLRQPAAARGRAPRPTRSRSPTPSVVARRTPWRTAIVGDLATVTESTLVDDLATPAKFRDTSWIHGGKVAWSWLSEHSSPSDFERQKDFVDFAARNGWDAVLVDEGWSADWVPDARPLRASPRRGDHPVVPLEPAGHRAGAGHRAAAGEELGRARREARLHGVRHAGAVPVVRRGPREDRRAAPDGQLPRLDDPARPRADVAAPDVDGSGARRGELPAAGQQPGAGVHPQRGRLDGLHAGVAGHRHQAGVVAHEVALPVVYESGWTHFADGPEAYERHPEALRFLNQVPTVWDETRLVAGHPATGAVFARRSGDRWFLGGISVRPGTHDDRAAGLPRPAAATGWSTSSATARRTRAATWCGPGRPCVRPRPCRWTCRATAGSRRSSAATRASLRRAAAVGGDRRGVGDARRRPTPSVGTTVEVTGTFTVTSGVARDVRFTAARRRAGR